MCGAGAAIWHRALHPSCAPRRRCRPLGAHRPRTDRLRRGSVAVHYLLLHRRAARRSARRCLPGQIRAGGRRRIGAGRYVCHPGQPAVAPDAGGGGGGPRAGCTPVGRPDCPRVANAQHAVQPGPGGRRPAGPAADGPPGRAADQRGAGPGHAAAERWPALVGGPAVCPGGCPAGAGAGLPPVELAAPECCGALSAAGDGEPAAPGPVDAAAQTPWGLGRLSGAAHQRGRARVAPVARPAPLRERKPAAAALAQPCLRPRGPDPAGQPGRPRAPGRWG